MAHTMLTPPLSGAYTAEEKMQLLANLDLEVSHRASQFEAWLADALENFRMHQEGLISRVPRLVRDITMQDFAKYNGDVQECLKGIQRERLGGEASGIDKGTRKRKWVESQETETKAGSTAGDSIDSETGKAPKTARLMAATPKKKVGPITAPGTGQRTRLPISKTPSTLRTMQRIPSRAPSPSPHKAGSTKPIPFPRFGNRPASPSKPSSPSKPANPPSRVPSASTFNPVISSASHPRWPRKDESMLSVNGSPLANPYQFGLGFAGWLRAPTGDEDIGDSTLPLGSKGDGKMGHKRTNSIIVRSNSSSNTHPSGLHSRSNSQASIVSSGQPSHSRSNSHTNGFVPVRQNGSSSQKSAMSSGHDPQTPQRPSVSLPSAAALVAVPTRDGHILEFDPLQTSPGEIDALEGITDSAKKQAKEDIARLVMQAVERWKIS